MDNSADPQNARGGGLSDAQLVERTLAQDDRQAFAELVLRHQRKALAVSYRLLGNTHDAAEVTQDAFLKAFNNLRSLESPDRFAGWLLRIVSNLSLNKRRDRKKTAPLPTDDLLFGGEISPGSGAPLSAHSSRADDPYQQLAGKELGQRLAAALEQLPEKQRLALVLFTVQQLPQKDVAQALSCSVEAVKWHVFQGRKKLRELLSDLLQVQ